MSSRADEDTTENGIQENEEDNNSDDDSTLPPSYASLGALWQAVAALQASAPSPSNFPLRIWKKRTVGELWLAFHERMPGLHFMPRKQIFSAPQPLLLASILYCSSVRGPTETATELAPHYFSILCHTISQLLVPESSVSSSIGTSAEEWAFQTVLGIVLASLLTEASNRVVGLWISVAYRLILEHCPTDGPDGPSGLPGGTEHADDGAREWRKLFSGVQIIDLEHASLHLSCPVIPMESPLPALRVGYRDQLYRLSRMMHTGLTHFTGRGLPTIWSVFGRDSGRIHVPPQFTATDAAVIRDWARQLDDWLVEFSRRTDVASTAEQQRLVFRQYVLHRLVVLSIYHPARGCNLWSNSITPQEQHELLLSARATLKLHLHDDSIWANWDLVMITWAALIVIQAVEGGVGESDDLQNIQVHLGMLKWVQKTHDPASSPCGRLIQRLEESLQRVHTPQQAMDTEQSSLVQQTPGMDYQSWHIFDQASLEQIGYVQWPLQG
ncbi:hypothetical protein SEUCBS139899_002072 [Sporothrix eucalyptigena]|uniref:Transcription factor domain-containing protein n=1 Tax=Sporothrix eucalyptigena TaxID=1812306 RepID=A0ABP0BX25_9PEZI